jgi:dolichyl-phosphate beta-glucosyltransferase
MSGAISLHLVVPCYRESARLPVFLPELCAAVDQFEGARVLVVDDGSGPEEAAKVRALVEGLRTQYACLRPLLELPENFGKGGAVHAGWTAHEGETWLGFVDADGSCSAAEVLRLAGLAAAESEPLPVLFASRIKLLGRRVERLLKRHLLGRIFAIPVYDSQCGLKLVPRAAYEAVAPKLRVRGFAFDVELLAALIDNGCEVREVPIDWHEVPGGKVRLLRDSWRMARDVWRIRDRRQRGWK